ncbi:unnamed protein product, partial [Oppiella nova]
ECRPQTRPDLPKLPVLASTVKQSLLSTVSIASTALYSRIAISSDVVAEPYSHTVYGYREVIALPECIGTDSRPTTTSSHTVPHVRHTHTPKHRVLRVCGLSGHPDPRALYSCSVGALTPLSYQCYQCSAKPTVFVLTPGHRPTTDHITPITTTWMLMTTCVSCMSC